MTYRRGIKTRKKGEESEENEKKGRTRRSKNKKTPDLTSGEGGLSEKKGEQL